MTTLAKLVVKLITDVSEFEAGMKNAAKKLDQIGQKMTQVGDNLTRGVTLPLVAAGTAAVKFASDLDETRNKSAVVFGSMAEDVKAMGETASSAMGMSERAALDFASTYGSILKNMGMSEQQTAEMSMSLTQLTADYASFHNLNPGEAFEKIKAGLVGSSEPLLSLGKDMRVAALEAYATANGIGEVGRELTSAELAQARFGLLMSQSTDELGDFSRTSDGLANSTRTLTAQLENMGASFGQVLIPTAISFMQALIPILQGFNDLPAPVKTSIVNFLMLAAALGPVLSAGGRVISMVAGVKGAFAAGGAITKIAPWLTGTLVPAIAAVSLPVWGLIAAIGALVFVIVKFGADAWNTVTMIVAIFATLGQQAGASLQMLGQIIQVTFQNAVRWIRGRVMEWYNAGRNLMAGLVNGVKSFGQSLINSVVGVVRNAIQAAKNLLGIHSDSKVTYKMGGNMMGGWAKGILAGSKIVEQAMGSVAISAPAVAAQYAPTGGEAFGASMAAQQMTSGATRAAPTVYVTVTGEMSETAKAKLKQDMLELFADVLKETL